MEIPFKTARGIAAAAIALAVEEQFSVRYAKVKPSVTIPHFNVPEATVLDYMHALLTGAAQVYMRDGDTVVRVDPRTFRDTAVIEALHRGEKITARVTHHSLVKDADAGAVSTGQFSALARAAQKDMRLIPAPTHGIKDEPSPWELTAHVFVLEDEFRAAVASDLPEIDDVPLPEGQAAGIASTVAFGQAAAVVIERVAEPAPSIQAKRKRGEPPPHADRGTHRGYDYDGLGRIANAVLRGDFGPMPADRSGYFRMIAEQELAKGEKTQSTAQIQDVIRKYDWLQEKWEMHVEQKAKTASR